MVGVGPAFRSGPLFFRGFGSLFIEQQSSVAARQVIARFSQKQMSPSEPTRSRTASILRDVHFWVPALVLLGGLLLLKFLH